MPGDLIGINKDSYLVLDALPAEFDNRVKAMEVDEQPTETYLYWWAGKTGLRYSVHVPKHIDTTDSDEGYCCYQPHRHPGSCTPSIWSSQFCQMTQHDRISSKFTPENWQHYLRGVVKKQNEFNGMQLKAVCVEVVNGMIVLREGATKLTHEHFVSGISEGLSVILTRSTDADLCTLFRPLSCDFVIPFGCYTVELQVVVSY